MTLPPEKQQGKGFVWRGGVPTEIQYERGFASADGFPYCYEINSVTQQPITALSIQPFENAAALIAYRENVLKREVRELIHQAAPKIEEYNRIQQFKPENERWSIAEPRDLLTDKKVLIVDANGIALTRRLLELIEEGLRPMAQLFEHVDLLLRRVSINHLNEARKDAHVKAATRYHEKARAVVSSRGSDIVIHQSPWFFTEDFEAKIEYEDDTTFK